jgi:hypothetical protein
MWRCGWPGCCWLLALAAGWVGPEALVDDWLVRSVGVLVDGGCASVTVVLGASADEARGLLAQASFAVPPQVVVARWCIWSTCRMWPPKSFSGL